jgi:uncharacterized protein with von Willebrand factor type A (vWA) domain
LFQRLYEGLRAARVPVTLREYLVLIDAVQRGVIEPRVEDFYHLARATLVKDERHIDRFDQVFARVYRGLAGPPGIEAELPEEWLKSLAGRTLTDEEKAQIEALGGWDKLMETLRQRLAEQRGRHEGGSKWIGTGGTSPFGNDGYNPEGVRIGQSGGRHGRAVKVWDRREFRNLDDQVELGTRNIKLALRRLRRFAREGAADEVALGGTIRETARHGYLDIRMRPERRNTVKLLLFLDVGGSMDPYVRSCEELFSAARSEFRHLEHYYFHNCLYERVWKDNRRRHDEGIGTLELLHRHGRDWRVVVVGDASMSPYEITEPGGSVEHMNAEPGAAWLARLVQQYEHLAWLNPTPPMAWATSSVRIVRGIIGDDRMYELTLGGIDAAMRGLAATRGSRQ